MAGHATHVVAPSSPEKKKSAHGKQEPVPAAGWYVPARHFAHTGVAYADAYVPATQMSQAVMPREPAAYPTAHSSQEAEFIAPL